MSETYQISKRVTTLLVYGRPPLIFGGMICALAVMWTREPSFYMAGILLLFVSMTFDLVDGWFAARFHPNSALAHLADRIMDKIVFSIIFPLVSVGTMWRVFVLTPDISKRELLHAIFVLLLTVTVLFRDNFANFMRGFAIRNNQEPELSEFTRLRTIVAAPVGALLYAYAFYVPSGSSSMLCQIISWLGNLPLRALYIIEISFLIINFASIAGYCRRYGTMCLDELCLGSDLLRRRILSFFPNALTVMNAIMGLLAVFFAYQGRIREAYMFLIGAAFFDKLDGAVARKLGLTDPLPMDEDKTSHITAGGIMDDISDAVSFCIAPAWIFYIVFKDFSDPLVQHIPVGVVALIYAILGIGRLVYFTLDRNPVPGFFKGIPTPAAAILTVAPVLIYDYALQEVSGTARFWGVLCFGMMIFSAVLMNIYRIRYIHLGRFMGRHPWFGRMTLLVLLSVFTPFFGHVSFLYMFLYMLSPLITWRIDPEVAAQETKNG